MSDIEVFLSQGVNKSHPVANRKYVLSEESNSINFSCFDQAVSDKKILARKSDTMGPISHRM